MEEALIKRVMTTQHRKQNSLWSAPCLWIKMPSPLQEKSISGDDFGIRRHTGDL